MIHVLHPHVTSLPILDFVFIMKTLTLFTKQIRWIKNNAREIRVFILLCIWGMHTSLVEISTLLYWLYQWEISHVGLQKAAIISQQFKLGKRTKEKKKTTEKKCICVDILVLSFCLWFMYVYYAIWYSLPLSHFNWNFNAVDPNCVALGDRVFYTRYSRQLCD